MELQKVLADKTALTQKQQSLVATIEELQASATVANSQQQQLKSQLSERDGAAKETATALQTLRTAHEVSGDANQPALHIHTTQSFTWPECFNCV